MSDALRQGSSHRVFEHTADIGIEASAPDLEGLLAEAGLALLETIYDRERAGAGTRVALSAEGEDEEDLLVRFLEEILFAFETRRLAFRGFVRLAVDAARHPLRVEADLEGEPYDADRHGYRCAVKAVTYHDLRIERTDAGLRARIILDL